MAPSRVIRRGALPHIAASGRQHRRLVGERTGDAADGASIRFRAIRR
jgi:hypothetical protein